MNENLFEEFQGKKQKLIALAEKAVKYGWITKERQAEINEKINNDTLTIGVIGQMKCGKSTFLNSFVFEDDVLPAATTPMTAALSVITYGKEKKIVAEFYTNEEWEEQKLMASRSLDEVQGNTMEESKIKAAKELVEKASRLGGSLTSCLGQSKEDDFANLIEYVGADGKYVSITKSVTIYYPKEYLKGVEIVDTPGFNDPIVSREERTKAFLKKADVVLMMLYAGRPFDATDRDIIFNNVRQCGIGKVIIGINKYDIPYENGETEDEIKEYVKQEINKACKACNDDTLKEIMKQAEPIPLSAEMALLSQLPISKINANDAFSHAWKRNCDTFEISSQSQMREKSHLDNLIFAVKKLIENEKENILFAKPLNAIKAAANSKREAIEKELRENVSLIQNLSIPDDELEEKLEKLKKANRRMNKKVDSLGDDFESVMTQIARTGKNQLEDEVDSACDRMHKYVDDWGTFQSINTLLPKFQKETQKLESRTLKRIVDDLSKRMKLEITNSMRDFLTNAEEICSRFIPDMDSHEFIKKEKNKIDISTENVCVSLGDDSSGSENEPGLFDYIEGFFSNFLNGATFGLSGMLGRALNHSDVAVQLHSDINSLSADFDADRIVEQLLGNNASNIIDTVKNDFITELIEPLQNQVENILADQGNKEEKKKEAETKVETLKAAKAEIDSQIAEILQNVDCM